MMRGNVLVLGGTGAIGLYLVPELLSAGFGVTVTTRCERASMDARLQYVTADAKDLGAIRSVLSGVKPDVIVDFMSYKTPAFASRCEELLGATAQYCFLSSYRVFADSSPALLTERSPRLLDVCNDTRYLATDEYALAKARQEDVMRASRKKNWTIVRPCITYSRNRFQLGTLEANTVCYRALQGVPVIMAREMLCRQTTMTWAGDVAKMIARLVHSESALGEDYNVVTAEHQSWGEVADYYKRAIGLRVVETSLDEYIDVVGSEYQVRYDRMFDRVMNNTKILTATGIRQSDLKRLSVGLEEELSAFSKSPSYQYPNFELNGRMDRATGTHISLAGQPIPCRIEYLVGKYPMLRRGRSLLRKVARKLLDRG